MCRVDKALPLFSLTRIARHFKGGSRIEIDKVDIGSGDKILISGPSGCGKSTILGLLSLSLKPTLGKSFLFNNHDILALWKKSRHDQLGRVRASYFGFIPQNAGLIPFLSVLENIRLSQSICGVKNLQWIKELVDRLELGTILDHKPHEISIGQRQRAAVARALAHKPTVIMADEPTASVHPYLADKILALLTVMVTELNSTLIMTSHDVQRGLDFGLTEISCDVDLHHQTTRLFYGS